MMAQHDDRRREVRHLARFDVRFGSAGDAARALHAFSVNFSAGGLCLKTKTSYEVGEMLDLAMTIEGELFELRGTVAWARPDAIGVRFVEVSEDDQARLSLALTHFSESSR